MTQPWGRAGLSLVQSPRTPCLLSEAQRESVLPPRARGGFPGPGGRDRQVGPTFKRVLSRGEGLVSRKLPRDMNWMQSQPFWVQGQLCHHLSFSLRLLPSPAEGGR